MGFEIDFFVSGDKTITEEEMYNFMDDFIELVEKYNWYCGGGVNLKDVNSED